MDAKNTDTREEGRVLYRLAGNKRVMGLVDEARLGMLEAFELQTAVLGPNHIETAITLISLGGLEVEVGRFDDAERRIQAGLEIYEQRLGADHLRLLEPLTGLTALYWSQGKPERAVELQERAVEICRAQPAGLHPDCAQPFANMGVLYRSVEGKAAEGLELLQQSVELREQHLGEGHPDLAFPLGSVADAYLNDGELDEAERFADRALAVLESNDSSDVLVTQLAEGVLARVQAARGLNDDAEARFLRILDSVRGSHLAGSIEEVRVLSWIGEFYLDLGRGREAVPVLEEALQMLRDLDFRDEGVIQELLSWIETALSLE